MHFVKTDAKQKTIKNYSIIKLLTNLRIMETKNLKIFGVYLGCTVANPGWTYVCVYVMHFCDEDAPAREICPENPYRLNARLIDNDDAKREELIRKLILLGRGSYVELHIKDVESGTIVSADDVIIKQEPEKVTVSRLAEELDEKF